MDFLNYWDTRIDANERFFSNYPHIANFAFSECQSLWDHMEKENTALRAELAALKESEHMMKTALRAKDADYAALRHAAGSLLSDVDKYYRCADIGDSRDKLAALVGRSEMDQCKHCIVRGDVAACEQTDCDKHEYWYTQTLRNRVARLEEAGRELLEACEAADIEGDLSEHVSGDMMFNFRRALEEK